MRNTITLTFHNDPGHGWLAVPFSLLKELDIADTISSFSYMSHDKAYLEEDCDAHKFEDAMARIGYRIFNERGPHPYWDTHFPENIDSEKKLVIKEKYSKGSSRIRSYGSFRADFLDVELTPGTLFQTPRGSTYKVIGDFRKVNFMVMDTADGRYYKIPKSQITDHFHKLVEEVPA